MTGPKLIALAILATMPLIGSHEWPMVADWFKFLKPAKKLIVGILIATFSALVMAVTIWPIVWEWIQYLS